MMEGGGESEKSRRLSSIGLGEDNLDQRDLLFADALPATARLLRLRICVLDR